MVGTVLALFRYPVKSCRGIALERAVVEARGLQHDRRWMFVDASGRMITQRTQPRLARVDVVVTDDAIVLSAPDLVASPLRLPLEPTGGAPRRSVVIWRDTVDAVDAGEEARRWASALLGEPAAIVGMAGDVQRAVTPEYGRPGDVVSFADAFPLLLASSSSLEDLNARMAPSPALPIDRFRPNVVVGGFEPWAEDRWRALRVGGLPVRIVKPCDRCVVTTTDQRTAERGAEPLRTLATFRKKANDVLFAVNGVPDATGVVAVGDPVTPVD